MVLITSPSGSIEHANPAFERVTGYSLGEVVGQDPRILRSGHPDEASYEEIRTQLSSGESWTGTISNRRKNGELFTEQATISPVRDAEGEIISYVRVSRDISQQLRLERDKAELEHQMRQSQKMEALGQLAGGVAHDFNNMIAAIRSNAELALTEASSASPEQLESLEDILAASERATNLTRQLLAFARKSVLTPQVLELGELIDELRSMLERLITSEIHLETKVPRTLGALRADKSQLQQVVMNLVLNARDAMSEGGHLLLEARDVLLDATHCEQHPGARPGAYVMLAVSDTGSGMTAEVQQRIFEPFFTTKDRERGTGLGLSTVFGIVQQSGGHICIYSEPDQGTTVRVYLPAVARQPESAENAPPKSTPTKAEASQVLSCRADVVAEDMSPTGGTADVLRPRERPAVRCPARGETCGGAPKALPGGDETVLVVEDDPLVLRATVNILERIGYRVLRAESGEEATLIAASFEAPIDLLFADVVMPGISGPELAQELCGTHPGLRVLFTSGYTHDIIVARRGINAKMPLLEKPFSAATLASRVRQTLDLPLDLDSAG